MYKLLIHPRFRALPTLRDYSSLLEVDHLHILILKHDEGLGSGQRARGNVADLPWDPIPIVDLRSIRGRKGIKTLGVGF